MDINVKINRIIQKNNLEAIATIDLENVIKIPNVRIIRGEHGLFLGYPQRDNNNLIEFEETEEGKELKKEIQNTVVDSYNKALEDNSLIGYGNGYDEEDKEILKDLAKDNLDKIQVSMNPEDSHGKQKASGEIVLDDKMILKGIRIMSSGEDNLFVTMPSESYEQDGKTKYKDIFYPLTADVRENISQKAQESYSKNVVAMENSTLPESEEQEEER